MIRRFFSYYKPHKKLFALDFSCAVLVGILELAFPLAVVWFTDTLIPTGDWPAILWVSAGLLGLYVLSAFLQFVVNYWGHKLGVNIETDMRQELFEHVHKQSFRFFDNTQTGHIMSRTTNDLFDIGELAHHGPEDIFIATMTFIGAFSIMFTLNVNVAMVIMVMVPLLIWLIYVCNVRMNRAWSKMYSDIADINARVEDSVAGARVVQSFTNERFEIKRFIKNNERFRRSKISSYFVMSYTTSAVFLLTRTITLVVLLYSAWLTYRGVLTQGELFAFILYVNILMRPVDKITALLELYPKGMAGFKRFTALLDQEPEIVDAPNAMAVPHLRGDIVFHDVHFSYEPGQPILQGINLHIKAGETVAFVGPSGAGKTTICSLIPRFYDVNEGAITIDGLDVRQMTKRSLRSQIGIVQQDVFLFTGTLRENIAYGNPNATDEQIYEAARRAHMEEFVQSLPLGYETQIGERGLKLSGGQQQRVAIARMFLKNPPILILDEATSALDTETEAIIQHALNELAHNSTTLIIAHRLATIRNADRIIVVTEQGIAEQGNHEELLARGGLYAHLHTAQF